MGICALARIQHNFDSKVATLSRKLDYRAGYNQDFQPTSPLSLQKPIISLTSRLAINSPTTLLILTVLKSVEGVREDTYT